MRYETDVDYSLMRALSALFLFTILLLFPYLTIAQDIIEKEYWMGIYSDGKRVGYSYNSIQRDGEHTRVKELTNLRINLLGKDSNVYTEGSYIVKGYKILSFEYEMRSDQINLKAQGIREGDNLTITMDTVSGKTERLLAIEKELILPTLVPQLLIDNELKQGESLDVPIFEPLTILMGISEPISNHKIEGEEVIDSSLGKFDTYRVHSNFMGADSTSWITKNGDIIKQQYPPSLVAKRESKEDIFSKKNSSFNIIQKTSIPANVKLEDPSSINYMKVKLGGLDTSEGFEIEDGYRQNVNGQIVEIKANNIKTVENPYVLPYDSKEYQNLLEADFLIQSDDTDIISITNKVVAGEKDPVKATKKINRWIYKNLKKSPTVSLPNAKDVLKTRVGDCNEHAALFTAMARAAGIPTKTVLGIVYIDNKFYYHAWNEVFIGEWVAVDSTNEQFPADATHIKLIEGNLAKSGEILKVVGKLNIEIIDAS